jgi:SAM-dependent methyltransferase
VISPVLVEMARCPDCRGALAPAAEGAACRSCLRRFDGTHGYLDLRPLAEFAEQTKYLDAALHADARHESAAAPVLGSRIRLDMLRRFLDPGAGDTLLDLGCGSGRTLVWTAGAGAFSAGIDISAFFSHEALERCHLVQGDLRRLPLRDAGFSKAWTLDVLEHLSPAALQDVLAEAHRVLAPGGALFVYTHVRKNGWIAIGTRLVNRFAHLCERIGLLDLTQERLRKSDHLNPLADHDELSRVVAASGLRIERVTYYTPIVGAFVENVLVRIAERALTRRASASAAGDADATRQARVAAQARVARRGWTYHALVALTFVMKVDLALFGRIQSGPFFALLRKPAAAKET